MTLPRMIGVLLGGLVVLAVVVILRAETTRLHYEISELELAAGEQRALLRAAELELARLRNPMLIRQRMEEALSELAEHGSSEEKPPSDGR